MWHISPSPCCMSLPLCFIGSVITGEGNMQQSKIQRHILISGVWDEGFLLSTFYWLLSWCASMGVCSTKPVLLCGKMGWSSNRSYIDISIHTVGTGLEWAVHSSNVNSCHGVSLSGVLYMSGQYVTDMFGMHFSTHYTK